MNTDCLIALSFSSFFFLFFIYSQFDWICCNQPRVSVCVSVRVFVRVMSTAQTEEPILMKLSTNHLLYICEVHFSPILKIQIWWGHGGHFSCFYIQSIWPSLTEYVAINPGCLSVCLSVFLCHLYYPNRWTARFWWNFIPKSPVLHLLNTFFSNFENSNWWRYCGHFSCFWMWHSHCHNFAPIFIKF